MLFEKINKKDINKTKLDGNILGSAILVPSPVINPVGYSDGVIFLKNFTKSPLQRLTAISGMYFGKKYKSLHGWVGISSLRTDDSIYDSNVLLWVSCKHNRYTKRKTKHTIANATETFVSMQNELSQVCGMALNHRFANRGLAPHWRITVS